MMVLGEVTQQKTYYDPQSVVEQITNPNTGFAMAFAAQKKKGEYGHPSFIGHGYTDTEKLERLMTVREESTSHLFTGLYTDAAASDGTVVVRADIKPTGPMGPTLKAELDDPVVNVAFSLRAYVSTEVGQDGLKRRKVRSLCTFDTVGSSGYKSTDKAHSIGLESFSGDTHHDYEINVMSDGNLMIDQIALESFSDNEMTEIFGSQLARVTQSRTFVETNKDLMARFPNLYQTGLFNELIKDI
jgi:hypothetical protein